MLDDPVPMRVCGACAAAVRTGAGGSWRACIGAPEFAAVWLEQYTRKRWVVYLCAAHRDLVEGAHPVTVDEQAELEQRREAERRALAGQGWMRPMPLDR